MTISFSLASVYTQLTSFANLSNFWSLFDTAFGSSYDSTTAATFKSQWQNQNFSQLPSIEVISSNILGNARGAYASSTNTIYLSEQFVSTASQESLDAVLLEEYGHFVDAHVNTTDTAGDEGAIFSAVVQGKSFEFEQLQQLRSRDDTATITLDGQLVQIEQAPTVSESGGKGGNTKKVFTLDSLPQGITERNVTLTYQYEHFSIPDQFELSYGTTPLFSTQTVVSGSKTGTVVVKQVQGRDTVDIKVTAETAGTAWNFTVSDKTAEINLDGLVGDVIKLDLSKERGKVTLKSSPNISKGKLINDKGENATVGTEYETLFYVPVVNGEISNYGEDKQHPGIGQVTFDVEDQDKKSLTVKVSVTDGFSTSGDNKVTTGTDKIDIYRQQQRLAYLGFPGSSGSPLDVDGVTGGNTTRAIQIFNVATNPALKGRGLVENQDDKFFKAYINSVNAPNWQLLTTVPKLTISSKSGRNYGIDPTGDITKNALAGLNFNLISTGAANKIGTASPSTSHEGGRGIDIDDVPGNFFKSNGLYVASPGGKIIVTNGTSYQAADPQNIPQGFQGLKTTTLASTTTDVIVTAVVNLLDYVLDKTKVEQILNAFQNAGSGSILYNDPRFLGTLTEFFKGHFDHIHVSINSPVAASAVPLSQFSRFSSQDFLGNEIVSENIENSTGLESSLLLAANTPLQNAIDLGTFEGDKNLTGLVNSPNPEQYYRFVLGNPVSTEDDEEAYFATFRTFSLLLNGLSDDIDVELIADFNKDGIRQDEEVVASSEQIGNNPESINFTDLPEDVYYVRVFQKGGDTGYNLSLSIPPLPVPPDNAGNSPNNAQNLGTLNGNLTRSDFIGAVDSDDYYRFDLDKISDFSAQVNGLDQGNLVVYLGQDINNDGTIDFDEIIAISEDIEGTNSPGAINVNGLATATYYVWLSRSSGNTNYNLNLSATPSVIPPDKAGSALATAFNLDTLATSIQSDFVGNVDPIDYYRFTLTNPSGVTLNLSGLSADADLELSQDKDGDGVISSDEVIRVSEEIDNQDENINLAALPAGDYFVKVSQYDGDTNYSFALTPTTATGVDLQVTVTPVTTPLTLGDQVSYTVTVKNIGASNATGVRLTDNLPLENILDVSAVTSKGTRSISSNAITANIGSLNVNESATLVVSGRLVGAGSTSSLIQASSAQTDFNPNNDSVVQRFNVAPGIIQPADLELSLTSDKTTANIDDLINFTITLTNNGPGAATSIQVKSVLPQGLTLVSSTPQQGSYDSTTGIWDAANIAKDNQAFIDIVAKVTSTQSLSLTAEVIAVAEPDPDSTPNNSTPSEDDQATVIINGNTLPDSPSTGNAPPKAINLVNTVTELDKNINTAGGVKIADIAISDDAQGINNLSLTGTDAASFEIRDQSLFFISTNIDFQTHNQYQVVVNVDDPSVGTNPDASTDFSLNITDARYTILESQGAVKLWKDTSTYFHVQNGNTPLTTIKYLNQSYASSNTDWQPLGAETVRGENQILWKNAATNQLGLWKTDANWNWLLSDVWDLNSPQTLSKEALFGVDANGDGVISTFTTVESVGNTAFVKDFANQLFAQVGTTTPISLQAFGQPISPSSFPGWEALALETINGENQVLWKNTADQSLYIWKTDANWNWLSSEAKGSLSSPQALDQETLFGTDANGDGSVGNPVAFNLTGTSGNDTLIGGSKNDVLTGLGGKDILTGGLGSDKFDYKTLTDSLLANFDVITDFNANAGNDLLLVTTARAGFSDAGVVGSLDAAGIGAVLNSTNFAANYGASFRFGGETFVAINDGIAGFDANTDALVKVPGLIGTLSSANFTTV